MPKEIPKIGEDTPGEGNGIQEWEPKPESAESEREREILTGLIGRLDGMYKDIRRLNVVGYGFLSDTTDACVQLCMAAQTLLEERLNEIDHASTKSPDDFRREVMNDIDNALTALRKRGDRAIIDVKPVVGKS